MAFRHLCAVGSGILFPFSLLSYFSVTERATSTELKVANDHLMLLYQASEYLEESLHEHPAPGLDSDDDHEDQSSFLRDECSP